MASHEQLAFVAGWADTRAAFTRWNRDVPGIVRSWAGTSFAIGCLLLLATLAVATWLAPDDRSMNPTFSGVPTIAGALHILARNTLVLAMHALICVAGYMATSSVPIAAQGYTGWKRRLHHAAAPFTITFVTGITISSFSTQAWTLGMIAPAVARAYDMQTWQLLGVLSIHALPELTAMFLPLGAWLFLARRKAWNELFAASVLATAIALPMLAMAAYVEEYVTPLAIQALM